jgi:hypothetical protein
LTTALERCCSSRSRWPPPRFNARCSLEGREFKLIQYKPPDRFLHVEFQHRSIRDDPGDASHFTDQTIIIGSNPVESVKVHGPANDGDFRDPHWTPVADIETTAGCEVTRWLSGEYTLATVAGDQGEQLRIQLEDNVRRHGDRLSAELGP